MKNLINCPHLHDREIKYCRIFINGVYIPMQAHLDFFCHSSKCQECFQFIKSQEQQYQIKQEPPVNINETRRQHLRFSQKWRLFIIDDIANIKNYKTWENQAQTIDISTGGFRISSKKKLTPFQKVHFFFENTLSAPFPAGIGEIKWSQPDLAQGEFQSGLALLG